MSLLRPSQLVLLAFPLLIGAVLGACRSTDHPSGVSKLSYDANLSYDAGALGVVLGRGTPLFPDESLTDWVSYAENLSVVKVISERPLEPNGSAIQGKDSYLPRQLMVETERVLWVSGLGGVEPPSPLVLGTLGWIQRGEQRLVATSQNAPRVEVGGRYVVPLIRNKQGNWGPLTASCYFSAEGDAIANADIAARGTGTIARDLGTRPLGDLKGILDNTPPEPVAVKHAALTPYERWVAVSAERDARERGREGRD